MEYRNIGGRSNKKYYSRKASNKAIDNFMYSYSNDIDTLLSLIEDKQRQINLLNKKNGTLSRTQSKLLNDLETQQDNLQKRLNRIGNKTKKTLLNDEVLNAQTENLISSIQNQQNKYKSISAWYADTRETKLINRMNAARSQLTTEYINKNAYDSKGNYIGLTPEQTKAMKDEVNKKLTEQFSKDIKQFDKSVKAFDTISGIVKDIVKVTFHIGKQALEKQANIYEETFSNISVRTGMSRSQYYSAQSGIRGNLTDRGLLNNIGADELQTMWNSMANNGVNLLDSNGNISDADVYAKAIDYVVTNKIVPYLDTTSKSIQLIDNRVDGKFIRDIRGINLANNELVGNNYMTQEILQKMIDFIEPMSDAALQQLAQSSEEMTLYANKLAAQGLSQDQITQLVNTTFKARNYGYNMLANGSTYEKMIMANSMINNINPNNPNQLNDFTAMVAGNNQFWASMSPGYNTATNSVISSAIGNAVGLDYSGLQTGLKLNERGIIPGSVQNTNLSDAQVKQYASTAYNEFAIKDKNQTNKQLQNITIGNFMTELSEVKEWMGEYSSVLESAIKGIYNLILAKIINGGIGKSVGKLVGSGGILSGAGGIALGTIGTIAAIGAISTAVANGIAQKERSAATNNGESYAGQYTTNEGDSSSAGISSAFATQYSRNEDTNMWKGVMWDNFGKNFAQGMSNNFNLNGYNQNDPISYNKEKWDRIMGTIHGKFTQDEMEWLINMYAMQIRNAGNDDSVVSAVLASGMSSAGVKAFLHQKELELSEKDMNNKLQWAVNTLAAYDLYPVGPNRHFTSMTMSEERLKELGLYRYGLSSVPYDNYPAILHQDEAVLTASTANELRNLIVEYRETNHQSINFEAIIQRQTTSLISKLNEVVTAINNINIGTGNNNRLSIVRNKLNNSMITVTSTKSFA